MQAAEEQTKASLEKLRASLQELGKYDAARHDDPALLRFLRARKFDHGKALQMMIDYEKWRVDENVDQIVKDFKFEEEAAVSVLYPRFYHKTDKLDRPVYIERLASLDCKKLFEVTTQDRMLKRYIREYEKLLNYRFTACSKKRGSLVDQGCTILDLKGVPLSQFNQVRKVVQSVSAIAQNYYPETLGKMFLINVPTLFTAVWLVVKGMLDENTVAKISVLGSNYQKTLLEHIDEENLPTFFGGKSVVTEGVDVGPWNDGTAEGFPQQFWEEMRLRDN